ncbi:histone-lysine N-methyltransferase Set8-like isoform X2 [Hydra vulgaris]|uniref:Histone-lysine N-methyltransferase Set8-like isoform X2 n=1 Tax=Hydra vulgaris TaxID=6087 RepID=A0ABM4C558_HYDVU
MMTDPDFIYKKFINKTKGYGVFACKNIQKGEFIVHYRGDLCLKCEMIEKEKVYEQTNAGSYVYDFMHNNIEYSIDATSHEEYLARYVNDSKYFPNAVMKKVLTEDRNLHLCLFALKEIKPNEEIVYFYGVDGLTWHAAELERKQEQIKKSKVNDIFLII